MCIIGEITMECINESTQGTTLCVQGNSRWINVETTVKEYDDGRITISTKYGKRPIGKLETTTNDTDIVFRPGMGGKW